MSNLLATDNAPALSEGDRVILDSVDRAARDHLALLLDALGNVPVSDAERRSLTWLAGWERHMIEHIAAAIRRSRAAGPPDPACLWCGTSPAPHIVLGDPLCESCHREHRARRPECVAATAHDTARPG